MIKKILVVDDDLGTRLSLDGCLTEAGYDVVTLENGQVAIQWLKKNSTDLVITDFNMPEMNGAELTELAKNQKPNMPVIIMTTRPRNVPVDHRANLVLEKPFKFEELQKTIISL